MPWVNGLDDILDNRCVFASLHSSFRFKIKIRICSLLFLYRPDYRYKF